MSEYPLTGDATARDVFNLRTVTRDAAHVVPHLRPGMRVVDFGCGAGSLTCGFAELVAPGEVLGIDLSEDAITRARALAVQHGLRNVQFSVANLGELELPSESFDVAHFNAVLMYLQEPDRPLRLAFGGVKSGGMLAAHVSMAMSRGLWHTFRANGRRGVLLGGVELGHAGLVQWAADDVTPILTIGSIGRSSLTRMGQRSRRSAGTTTLRSTSSFHSEPAARPSVQHRRWE